MYTKDSRKKEFGITRARSSAEQSTGLRNRGSWVRIPPGVPLFGKDERTLLNWFILARLSQARWGYSQVNLLKLCLSRSFPESFLPIFEVGNYLCFDRKVNYGK